jgi:cytochrome P450
MANENKRSAFMKAFHYVNLSHIPGPRGMAFFSYVRFFQQNILGAFTRVNREYKDIASFPWPMNSIIIYSPELLKSVLVENNRSYIKGEQIEELRAIVGNGLATNNNHESWLKSRALLAKEFNTKSVTKMTGVFEDLCQQTFAQYKNARTEIDMCEVMKLLTFEIACETILGKKLSAEDAKKVNEAVHYTSIVTYERIFKFFPLPYWMPTKTNFLFNKHFNNLNGIVLRLIKEARENHSLDKNNILYKLVFAKDEETQFSFSDSELRDEILTLLLAGHETSAHSLTWIFGLLAKHSDIQQKLFEELKATDGISPIDYQEKCPYLKAVLLESMRLYPAFPVLSRKTSEETSLGKYKIPKNTNVVIPIFVTQRNEENWKDALTFRPERFLQDGAEKSYAFLPFSRGSRRCIAELFAMVEMSIIVVTVLKSFELNLSQKDLPEAVASVSLKPVNGMKLNLQRRF